MPSPRLISSPRSWVWAAFCWVYCFSGPRAMAACKPRPPPSFEPCQRDGIIPLFRRGDSLSKAHDALVRGQFGPRANAYVESAVHAQGEDLLALDAVVAAAKPARALDLGCGGGHVAYL